MLRLAPGGTGNSRATVKPAKFATQIAILAPTGVGTRPALCGVAGEYAGKTFSLDAGPSVLGRDQRAANLVFASQADSISKRPWATW